MMDKETDIDRELGKHVKKLNEQQYEIDKQIDSILAYGSVNLGLNNIKRENYSEERIKEDLKK
ncbi:hypothetical protein CPJCM30710_27380 [Clostridium polyendosporum]|uniref:Uncharacterized protein n=1 Tax=Clostridium polyendosporum TaxID=69208 RepID=A0A919S0W4_9CLOT|nr:hypothetical protein [Clostridium polyendosporum]GIM30072.1 hypothetical protein CPJCM30710_27380 [Clostridium polyendosporum]